MANIQRFILEQISLVGNNPTEEKKIQLYNNMVGFLNDYLLEIQPQYDLIKDLPAEVRDGYDVAKQRSNILEQINVYQNLINEAEGE